VFLIFVLGGTVAGAVVALTPRIEVFLVFAFPTLMPVIGQTFLQSDKTHRMMGLMLLLYLLTLFITAWRVYSTIRSSLALQHEKEDLLQQLRSLSLSVSRAEHRERKRLATSLHDNLAQTLALCKMKLHIVSRKVAAQPWAASLLQVAAFVDEGLTYTRTLMSELRPPQYGDEGDLGMAIIWVADKLQRHGLTVSIEDDGEPKPVDEDQLTMLYQAVHELLYNVLKHANTGHATVSLRRVHQTVVITVRDEGRGFETWRDDGSPRHTGFGLLNIRERAQQVGAQFHMESKRGQGTLVTLTVPLKKDTKGLIREGGSPSGSQARRLDATEQIRVMLVDDHEMIREGLRTIINGQEDLRVVGESSDGSLAMACVRECQPDVILMDINMPTLNGVETTRRIKAELPGIAVIGLSVHEDDRMALNMRDAGASAYLSKGGSFEALCDTIRQTIERQGCG
jgi:signal transduction histidine kinase/CheY-like chemotaxis protein